MVVQHHSITDVISLSILGRDLSAAYRAALHRSKPQWPPLSVAYIDYAAWQRASLDTAALEAELAWWRQTLAGAPALLEWQTDRPRPSTMSFAGAQLRFAAPAVCVPGHSAACYYPADNTIRGRADRSAGNHWHPKPRGLLHSGLGFWPWLTILWSAHKRADDLLRMCIMQVLLHKYSMQG